MSFHNEKMLMSQLIIKLFDVDSIKLLNMTTELIKMSITTPMGYLAAIRLLLHDSVVVSFDTTVELTTYDERSCRIGNSITRNDELAAAYVALGNLVATGKRITVEAFFSSVKMVVGKYAWWDAVPYWARASVSGEGQAKLLSNLLFLLPELEVDSSYTMLVMGSSSPCVNSGGAYLMFMILCEDMGIHITIDAYDIFEQNGDVPYYNSIIHYHSKLAPVHGSYDIVIDDRWSPDMSHCVRPRSKYYSYKEFKQSAIAQPFFHGTMNEVRDESHSLYKPVAFECRCAECTYVSMYVASTTMSDYVEYSLWSYILAASGHDMMDYSADIYYMIKMFLFLKHYGPTSSLRIVEYVGKPTMCASVLGLDFNDIHPVIRKKTTSDGDLFYLGTYDSAIDYIDFSDGGKGYTVQLANTNDCVVKVNDFLQPELKLYVSMTMHPSTIITKYVGDRVFYRGKCYFWKNGRYHTYVVGKNIAKEVLRIDNDNNRYFHTHVSTMIRYGGKFIVIVRNNGVADLPGGRMRVNETMLDTAKREVKEELGDLITYKWEYVTEFFDTSRGIRKHVLFKCVANGYTKRNGSKLYTGSDRSTVLLARAWALYA